jgi:DNA modification methylase
VIYQGDCRAVMRQLIEQGIKVQTCVTSPPYWGLRNYNHEGQMGLEETPEQYVAVMVEVFGLVSQLLQDDGTIWLNLGDSYAGSGKGAWANKNGGQKEVYIPDPDSPQMQIPKVPSGLKPKDLVGIPWRVAFALQAAGLYLRCDIIWSKPNPMPESVTDRPTKSHEYIFLFSKKPQYYYDYEAIKEPGVWDIDGTGTIKRKERAAEDQKSAPTEMKNGIRPLYKDAKKFNGKHSDKQRGHSRRHAGFNDRWDAMDKAEQCSGMRNKRSVWEVPTRPFAGAHFATFPPNLIEPCILAGARPGDIVLDPFSGSGTTGMVAYEHGREFIGIELNPAYIEMAEGRTSMVQVDMLTSLAKPSVDAPHCQKHAHKSCLSSPDHNAPSELPVKKSS